MVNQTNHIFSCRESTFEIYRESGQLIEAATRTQNILKKEGTDKIGNSEKERTGCGH